MIIVGLFLSVCIIATLLVVFAWAWWNPHRGSEISTIDWPKVSVLVPARNEEENLPRCLQALLASDYPKEKLEILVGNDHSTDDTSQIIRRFAQQFEQVSYVEVGPNLGNAKAKANALVYLTKAASHDIWLFTDADIEPHRGWVKAMVSLQEKEKVALVAGVTIVDSNNVWGRMQKVDWMMGWGLIQVCFEKGQPVTSAGNNMLVTREAYESVGGYETLPFSVTEDFTLYHAIQKVGFRVHHEFSAASKASTQPMSNLKSLLSQRKRWMKGGTALPFWLVGLLVAQALFYPSIVALLFLKPVLGLSILALKWLFQSIFIKRVAKRIEEKLSLFEVLAFEIYSSFLSTILIAYYLWPAPIRWKGREL